MENDEDMLDFFAGCVMVGDWAARSTDMGKGVYAAEDRARTYYTQARAMLQVRKEFIGQGEANSD